MHYKLEDIPLLSYYPGGAGLMRSVKAGEMQIGDVWAHIPIDYTDAYAGFPDGMCPYTHYGYVIEGQIRVRYLDGEEEVISAGSAYHLTPGHILSYDEPSHHLEFNYDAEIIEQTQRLMPEGTILSEADEATADPQ